MPDEKWAIETTSELELLRFPNFQLTEKRILCQKAKRLQLLIVGTLPLNKVSKFRLNTSLHTENSVVYNIVEEGLLHFAKLFSNSQDLQPAL